MSLKDDGFPSSSHFDVISRSLSENEAERAQSIKNGDAIFCFTLKNLQGRVESWYMDLKETGKVGRGTAPSGKTPDVTLSLSDEDFGKLVSGKIGSQRLFVAGRLKVKGDVMKALRGESVLKKSQTPSKL
ncbi:MAG: hypothetical protein M1826_003795 [Phylliscum demangeonii]|nr:MAG: hypothetical protein M1826_003795 [Phylliscum demangeonii]